MPLQYKMRSWQCNDTHGHYLTSYPTIVLFTVGASGWVSLLTTKTFSSSLCSCSNSSGSCLVYKLVCVMCGYFNKVRPSSLASNKHVMFRNNDSHHSNGRDCQTAKLDIMDPTSLVLITTFLRVLILHSSFIMKGLFWRFSLHEWKMMISN